MPAAASQATDRAPITGLGLVTSVGRSAAAACAAIRAGVSRPLPLPFEAVDADTLDPVAVTGYPARGLTDGFVLCARWLQLARACVADLASAAPLPPPGDAAFWSRTALFAALPPMVGARFQNEDGSAEVPRSAVLAPLCRSAGLAIDDRRQLLFPLGHAAALVAVRQAADALRRGTVDRVLVLAVDSLIDPLTLEWLAGDGRLKSEDVPTGLSPGEAAACLLLETEASARRRGAEVVATVTAPAFEQGRAFDADPPDAGEALADCARAALAIAAPRGEFEGDVVTDLNGESWRAMQWGMAQVRLGGILGDHQLHAPAESVGDTGAASGGLGICYAAHLLARGAAARPAVLVLSSAEDGRAAAAVVEGASE
jgi:3-oxoacyl-[acyl-carrier-protein] synthase-1